MLAGTYKPCDLVNTMRDSGTGCRVLVSKRGCALAILCILNQGHNTQCRTPNVTWKLNIKTTKPTILRQHTCRGEQRSPALVARQTLRYPYNIRQQCVLSPTTFMLSQQPRITTQRICRGRRPRRPASQRFVHNLICVISTTLGTLFQNTIRRNISSHGTST